MDKVAIGRINFLGNNAGVIGVNLTGTFLCSKYAYPYLKKELGPDIRVNCISPGWIEVSEWKKKSLRKPAELTELDH